MKLTLVSITDNEMTSRVLNLYFREVLTHSVDFFFTTYRRTQLARTHFRQADLFIVELFTTDEMGLRAEGIFAAEKLISLGKRSLIISGASKSSEIKSPVYWDLAAPEELRDRVFYLIKAPLPHETDLESTKRNFYKYYRPPLDPHRI